MVHLQVTIRHVTNHALPIPEEALGQERHREGFVTLPLRLLMTVASMEMSRSVAGEDNPLMCEPYAVA
jgi:hypothetical protein